MIVKNDYLKFAEDLVRKAGTLLKKKLPGKHKIYFKGEINLVTEADRMSEVFLMQKIRSSFPHHDIQTEESAGVQSGSDFRWIIDPLDGTTNYAHGYPVFCVSVALEIKSAICLGVIYNPMLEEMFTAQKGGGAFLNGQAIEVSNTEKLSRSLLATGFPYDIRESKENNINNFIMMALKAQAIRRAGSAALDLAYVAAGRFDGFWELKLMPWDTAAGWLMIEEAGGAVTNLFGKDYSLTSGHILATNGKIHKEMIEVLASCASL
jgi:myo-inositol-1(or 4)-monophosphatase